MGADGGPGGRQARRLQSRSCQPQRYPTRAGATVAGPCVLTGNERNRFCSKRNRNCQEPVRTGDLQNWNMLLHAMMPKYAQNMLLHRLQHSKYADYMHKINICSYIAVNMHKICHYIDLNIANMQKIYAKNMHSICIHMHTICRQCADNVQIYA